MAESGAAEGGGGDGPRRGAKVDSPRLTALRELQLVESYRKGGPGAYAAIEELIRSYQRRVYSICYRMVKHEADAADLTQDVLLKVVENLPTYNGQSKLSTWVIRVTMNHCLTHLRKEKIRDHKSLDRAGMGHGSGENAGAGRGGSGVGGAAGGGGVAGGLRSKEPLPAESVEQAQLREALLSALEGLDAPSRAILVLRDMQDLDYEQLAEVLEIPLGTVKSRLFRARAALRAAVEGKGFSAEG
ncbi:MAG: sigma-70 family RNA polymerase sigma factor [Phycisphaerales bacterium]|nr:sigma-70 family RNA polymerase sigma factor [Phycisphaerales bacterium]